jgi:hypothetical protein
MADLGEAFTTMKFPKKDFQTIDYFFTQRTLTEEREYIDKQMNRKTKKVKVIHNFLAINIPSVYETTSGLNEVNDDNDDKPISFDIELFGDKGYHYKGSITSHQGIVPNLIVPLKGDKKIFVLVVQKEPNTKRWTNFIEVSKRYQTFNDDNSSQTDEVDV